MTDPVKNADGKRKPSAIFAQRYREKARLLKQQFDQNLMSLEKSNEYLKNKQQQLENAVAMMKNYVQHMNNKDSNLNESISTSQYVATDFIRSTRTVDNNHVDNPTQFDHNQMVDYNIPCFLLDEETYIRSPVQPEAGDQDRIEFINSQSRTHNFEILDNLPMDLDEKSHQELVDLRDVDIDSVWGNSRGEDFNSEEQFDLEAIYNILPHLSLHQGELNNLEVMKIEEMLRSEVAKHSQLLPTKNGLTMSDKLNGDQSLNSPFDPKRGDFLFADSSASNSPYSTAYTNSTPGDQFEHDDIINYMLTDANMEVNFEIF